VLGVCEKKGKKGDSADCYSERQNVQGKKIVLNATIRSY
jgi:hypothetical protein